MLAVLSTGVLVADGSGCRPKWSRGVVLFFVHCLSLLQPDTENERLRHRYQGSGCKNAFKECEIANDYLPQSMDTQYTYIHTFIWVSLMRQMLIISWHFQSIPI